MANPDGAIVVRSVDGVRQLDLTYPVKVRPLFSVQHSVVIADNQETLIHLVGYALDASATGEVAIILTDYTDDDSKIAEATNLGPREPNNDMVICPNCTCQFRAIPVNVQKELVELQEKWEEKNAETDRLWSTIFHD